MALLVPRISSAQPRDTASLDNFLVLEVFPTDLSVIRERSVRRDTSLEETVDFLKREASHFGNEEEDKGRGEEVCAKKYKALRGSS